MSYQIENNITTEGPISEQYKNDNSPFINFYSNFLNNKNLYSKEDLEKIYDYITIILGKKFSTAKEVCETIQNFILVSKYNLKRINSLKSDLITFCCSCASRKVPLIRKKNRKNSDSNLVSLKYSDNDNFINNNDDEINFFKFAKKRKIKRWNVDACTFRIKFKLNFEENYYSFKNTKNLIHNHSPNLPNEQKNFSIFYKNIKFPNKIFFDTLNYIMNHPEIESKKYTTFEELRLRLINEYDLLTNYPIKIKTIIKKKLNHFISVLINLKNSTYQKLNIKDEENKNELFDILIKSFLKKTPSSYLRLEDVQELIEKYNYR